MAFEKSITDILKRPLVAHRLGSQGYKYMKVSEVIDILNEAFGYSWSTRITNLEKTGGFVVATVEISTKDSNGNTVFKQGVGGTEIKIYSKGTRKGEIVDISNDYASAVASALKNAAKQFGLKATDTPTVVDTAQRERKSPQPPQSVRPSAGTNIIKQTLNNNALNPSRSASVVVETKVPERASPPSNPFPTSTGDKKLSSVQLAALEKLSATVGMTATTLIGGAVFGSNKKSFDELNMKEAAAVIKHANTVMNKGR